MAFRETHGNKAEFAHGGHIDRRIITAYAGAPPGMDGEARRGKRSARTEHDGEARRLAPGKWTCWDGEFYADMYMSFWMPIQRDQWL
jgi:hypothetical protein